MCREIQIPDGETAINAATRSILWSLIDEGNRASDTTVQLVADDLRKVWRQAVTDTLYAVAQYLDPTSEQNVVAAAAYARDLSRRVNAIRPRHRRRSEPHGEDGRADPRT